MQHLAFSTKADLNIFFYLPEEKFLPVKAKDKIRTRKRNNGVTYIHKKQKMTVRQYKLIVSSPNEGECLTS